MNKNPKPLCTLYSNFRLTKNKSEVNDIIFLTKKLTLNNRKYTNYIETYEKSTQLSSFKEPNMSSYPLFQNKDYISLQRLDNNTYQHSFRESYINKKKKNNNNKFKKLFLKTEINHINEKNNNNNLNTSELLETEGTNYPIIENNKNKKGEKIDHKDLFLLCDLLFNEIYYKNCEYDEKKIFNNLKNHELFLKNKLVFMKVTNENRLNTTSILKHTFTNKRYGKIDLILNSINLEIRKGNEVKNDNIFSIKIPFDFTPSIYLSNFEELKQIIVGLIKYNLQNNTLEINNDYFEIYWPNIFNDNGEIIHYREIFKSFRDVVVKNEFNLESSNSELNKYLKSIHFENNNESLNIDFENIFDPKYKNVDSKKYKKQIFNSSITHFEIELLLNNEIYFINVTMPHIVLKFMKFKKNIVEYIDKELFIYCLEQKFINWDFYMTRYLFSLKNFRKFIQILLSKNNDLSKTTINFNNRNENYELFLKNLYYEKVNNCLCYTLNYNPLRINKVSKNDFSYSFILTDSKTYKNNLFKIFPYVIYIFNPYINNSKIFSFHFTLFQMKILFYVSRKERLETFILKLVQENLKTKSLDLDYSYFEIFKKFNINQIEEYLEMIEKRSNVNIKENKISINSYQVIVLKPHFESIQLKDEKKIKDPKENKMIWLCSSHDLNDKLTHLLVNNDIEKWPEIVEQFHINLDDLYNNNNSLMTRGKTITYTNNKMVFSSPNRRSTMVRKNSYNGSANKKGFNKSKTILNLKKND